MIIKRNEKMMENLNRYQVYIHLILFSLYIGCSTPVTTKKESLQDIAVINPVLPGDIPDPTAVKIGDTYYASATSNEWLPLFPIFKSKDLINWELVTYVFPESAPDWAVNNFWAPELAYDEKQNKVYAYYTARDKNTNRLSVAVVSASSPEGPYQDHGPLVAQELGSIDAYEIRDENGKLFLAWKEDGNSKGQPTPIWAQEINESRTQLLGEKHELFRNDEDWEGRLVEGVAIFRRGKYFYATYSAGACCETSCNYKTGVARAESLLGSWEKYDQNPVLKDNEEWKCLGHGTVVEKGNDFYLLYHAYNKEGSVFVGREGVLEKIEWTDDDWPYFKNETSYNRKRNSVNFQDDFKTGLKPEWQWRVTQDIKYETGEDGLLLWASKENNDIGSLLVLPLKSPDYVIETKINLDASDENSEGGIALIGAAHNGFGAPIAAIGISVENRKIKVWETNKGKTTKLGEVTYKSPEDDIDLKIEVKDGYLLSFLWKDEEKWSAIKENLDASYLVPWGMGFRLGLVAKGDPTQKINFRKVSLENH